MADGFIQVAPDGTGKKMQTFVNNDEHAEAVALVDINGDPITTLPVSGTFWQATQPVSGPLTDVQLRATAVEVDGSGVTQPVSGTFWQATQPVSGPLTDAQLRATVVPVSDSSTTQRTCASTIVSVTGSVSAGKQSVQFVPSSDFTGTLLGAAWPGTNAAIGFSANGNDTLAAIAYTRTTGSITILTIT